MGWLSDTLGGITDAIGLTNRSGDKALNAQTNATNQANRTMREMFDIQRADQQPWMQAGRTALSQLANPDLMKTFSMNDFQQDPGYQFRMDQGMQALERSAAARGGLMGGGTLKALSRFGQDYASNEFQNAYNRFNNDRDQRFNKLASLAGVGQSAANQIGQAGMNYGNNVAQNQIGLGNAAAANYMAPANRLGNILGQAGGAAAGALIASDERLKTDIREVSHEDLKELRDNIKPYIFKYINDDFGKGDFLGVMAQDLEKSRLGKLLVEENEQGLKFINVQKFISMLLATMKLEGEAHAS